MRREWLWDPGGCALGGDGAPAVDGSRRSDSRVSPRIAPAGGPPLPSCGRRSGELWPMSLRRNRAQVLVSVEERRVDRGLRRVALVAADCGHEWCSNRAMLSRSRRGVRG